MTNQVYLWNCVIRPKIHDLILPLFILIAYAKASVEIYHRILSVIIDIGFLQFITKSQTFNYPYRLSYFANLRTRMPLSVSAKDPWSRK